MLELKSKNGDKMVESNDDIEFSERDLALIEALRKVKKKKRRKYKCKKRAKNNAENDEKKI